MHPAVGNKTKYVPISISMIAQSEIKLLLYLSLLTTSTSSSAGLLAVLTPSSGSVSDSKLQLSHWLHLVTKQILCSTDINIQPDQDT